MATTHLALPDLFMLPDYCARCLAAGCDRLAALADPDEISWRRGSATVTTAYACDRCGHTWRGTWPTWGLFGPGELP